MFRSCVFLSEMSVRFYQTARRYIPKYVRLHVAEPSELLLCTVGIYCKDLAKLQCTVWATAGGVQAVCRRCARGVQAVCRRCARGVQAVITVGRNGLRLSSLYDTDLYISLTVRFKWDIRLLLRYI